MRRTERLRTEAAERERERLTQWLRFLVVRTRGKAASFAAQALNSDDWPPESVRPGPARKKTP